MGSPVDLVTVGAATTVLAVCDGETEDGAVRSGDDNVEVSGTEPAAGSCTQATRRSSVTSEIMSVRLRVPSIPDLHRSATSLCSHMLLGIWDDLHSEWFRI
jgi:hypothetical protein